MIDIDGVVYNNAIVIQEQEFQLLCEQAFTVDLGEGHHFEEEDPIIVNSSNTDIPDGNYQVYIVIDDDNTVILVPSSLEEDSCHKTDEKFKDRIPKT